ncbi:MAG: NAD(P)H-dependent oxidoreductase subunit E [Spirochaetales bacterium]|nr:NAD(P)H-dependent oxidoreductase subunit E [Spirochaetales bacterium]
MMIDVEICMGSSCYSRGNSKSLEFIETFIKDRNLEDRIRLNGKLCLGSCSDGPNIIINKNLHSGTSPECIIDLIKHYLTAEEAR